jgi:four helix bundle protein
MTNTTQPDPRPRFEVDRLDVYRVGLDFVQFALRSVQHTPYEFRAVADQLRRAALSVPLNVAEGAGEYSAPEKRRFYRIARRSAFECVALLDVLFRTDRLSNVDARTGYALLDRLIAMLSKLARPPRTP